MSLVLKYICVCINSRTNPRKVMFTLTAINLANRAVLLMHPCFVFETQVSTVFFLSNMDYSTAMFREKLQGLIYMVVPSLSDSSIKQC